MFTHYYFRQRAQATQGPVLSQQRKPTPHVVSDEGTDEEEEEEEEVTSQTDSASQRQNTAQDRPNTPHSQPSAPQPNPKAPARGKKRKATNREDTVQLQGIDLYRSLLSEGKISGSTNIMKCMDLDLHPKDLKEIFPHIELSVLSSASSLIITLKSLEEMNRQSEPKTNTTAKISMETLQNNKALVTKMRTFPECEDDLSLQHTSTRVFHRLPLASMKQLFVECAKKHVDLTPILAYDLTDINGGSHIREKGWQTIHNPGTQNPSIRDFMTRSYGNNQSKKLKLDEDFSIVETSQVKDADTIKEVKKGLILMIRLYHQVHPTLLNYLTLLNFMTEMDWLYNCDRKGLPQVTYAVAFVDFYLNAIGDHFRNCTPPRTRPNFILYSKLFMILLQYAPTPPILQIPTPTGAEETGAAEVVKEVNLALPGTRTHLAPTTTLGITTNLAQGAPTTAPTPRNSWSVTTSTNPRDVTGPAQRHPTTASTMG